MQDIVPLLISLALGTLIGWERQLGRKPAGMRTHTLVCLGSTTFMLLHRFVAEHVGSLSDPTRIIQGVVTGIGFLGAGTILRTADGVHGLTTAAGIWVVAAIGVAVGLHAYALATSATLLTLFVLRGFRWIEGKIAGEEREE